MNFEKLWEAYPEESPCSDSGTGEPFFENQCAIRMGVALNSVHFPIKNFNGAYCWHHSRKLCHTLRVEELVEFLEKYFEKDKVVTVEASGNIIKPEDFCGKSGIVCFFNFWGVGRQGDHIDLFDGHRLKDGSLDYFERSEKVKLFEI